MSYYLGVRWAQRSESLSICAARFACMLEGLAAAHPTLAEWRRQAPTRAAAYKPFCAMPPRLNELEAILERGRYFEGASNERIPELGYSAAAWNGLDEPQALSIRLQVGSLARRLYPNEVELSGLRRENASLVNGVVLKRILMTIANCWEADWGIIKDWGHERWKVDSGGRPFLPYGGWLTYLSPALAEKVMPPPGVHAERTPNGGIFMLVSEKPFDVSNPAHIAQLDAVQKSLAPVQRSIAEMGH